MERAPQPTDSGRRGFFNRGLLGFPNPVNEVAARTVAAGVVVMAVVAVAADVPWLLIPLTYGFWARVLTGPRLSPLGLLATRVIVPRLPVAERLTPGPPKRFAQAIGALVTTTAVIMWVTAGWADARWLLLLIIVAAVAESAFGFCVGCRIFSLLMRHGVIPTSVCEECGDLGRRHPELAHRAE